MRRPIAASLVWLAGTVVAAGAPEVATWPVDAATTAALVSDSRAPLVELRLEFPAGSWSPWVRRSHAQEAFEMQMDDTGRRLHQRADLLAVEVSLAVHERSAVLRASFLSRDLDAALELVRDVLTNREFDRREIGRRDRARRLAWKAAEKQPFFRGAQATARALFAEGDPRRLEFEEPERLVSDPRRLAEARDLLISLPGRVIGFAGDLTRERAERAARDLLRPPLDEPPADLVPVLAPLVPPADRPADIVVDLPRLTQVYFGHCAEAPGCNDPDYPALLLADHVLGGHFYSRLHQALRHEGGETYGAWTVLARDTGTTPYAVVTFTRTSNAAHARDKLRQTLDRFRAAGVTEEERQDAAGYLLGRRALETQSPAQVLDRYLEERRLGLPPGGLDQLVQRATRLSLEEINRFIERFYEAARFTSVRVE